MERDESLEQNEVEFAGKASQVDQGDECSPSAEIRLKDQSLQQSETHNQKKELEEVPSDVENSAEPTTGENFRVDEKVITTGGATRAEDNADIAKASDTLVQGIAEPGTRGPRPIITAERRPTEKSQLENANGLFPSKRQKLPIPEGAPNCLRELRFV
jgi:hypothetical protein